MTEFKIGSYTIGNKEVYEVLKQENVSDNVLKQLDLNGDNKISEDELQELLLSNEDENNDNNSATDAPVELSDTVTAQIQYLDKQYAELRKQMSSLTSQIGQAADLETYQSIQGQIDQTRSSMNSNRMNVYNLLVAAENQALSQTASASGVSTVSGAPGVTSGTGISGGTSFGNAIVSIAQSFVGKLKETDGSYLQVTGGRAEHWCADFVTYVVSKACEQTGTSLNGFGSPSVSTLQAWGQANNCYIDVAGSSNRAQTIVNNVQPGDVMIQKNSGASHTGIVTKVYSDGSFDTIEGNTSDQCLPRHYSASDAKLSGFVKIT